MSTGVNINKWVLGVNTGVNPNCLNTEHSVANMLGWFDTAGRPMAKTTASPCLFFFFNYLFIYLFMALLGLRFCKRASSSWGKRGPLFIAVRGPLTIAASLVAEHRLQTRRLSNCGSRAQSLRGVWDLPRPGLEPVSPALAGRFSTTAPPGKPSPCLLRLAGQGLGQHCVSRLQPEKQHR